jgi:hypothetical protein
MTETARIFASMTAVEQEMYRFAGGVIPAGIRPAVAEWAVPVKFRLTRLAPHSQKVGGRLPAIRVVIEGLGRFDSIRQAATSVGMSDREFGRQLHEGRKWIGGWRVKVLEKRKAA